MLTHTSTACSPWHVIPADRKWFARIACAAVIASALIQLDPRYPTTSKTKRSELAQIKVELEMQAPTGAAPDPFEAGPTKARDDGGPGPS